MTRFYPECDSNECEVCPRREDCDIREEEDEDGIPLEADPAQELVLDDLERKIIGMKAEIAQLKTDVRRLMRNESELVAGLGRWVGQVEGGDYD